MSESGEIKASAGIPTEGQVEATHKNASEKPTNDRGKRTKTGELSKRAR